MTINYKYVAAGIAILGAFASGRFSVKTVTTQVAQTQTVDQNVKQDKKIDDNKTITTNTTTVKPDGTKSTTTTVITDNKKTDTATNSNTQSVTDTKTSTTTSGSNSGGSDLIVAGAIGIDFKNPGNYLYGFDISNKLIGPVRIGIIGLSGSNTLSGLVTLGLQFK